MKGSPALAATVGSGAIRMHVLLPIAFVWFVFLSYSAFKSAEMFATGFGIAPAYGDTVEYWQNAQLLRVDGVRTWTYPLLLRMAPGAVGSQVSIAFMQSIQMVASVAAASYLGWVVARLLRLQAPWSLALVGSSAILSGASFIAIHMAHSILTDSLASSAWLVLTGALMLLLGSQPVRAWTWLVTAVPAGALVAGLRWERVYLAILLIALAGGLTAKMRPRLTTHEHRLRLSLCGVLAATTLSMFFLTKYTFKVESARHLEGTGALFSHALTTPSTFIKTFVESLVAPISTVAATSPGSSLDAANGAVEWTNTRIMEQLGYWPAYLWLASALLVATTLIVSIVSGLPGLLGFETQERHSWLLALIALVGLTALNGLIYQFHPRYCVPITGFELTLAAALPHVLARRWWLGNAEHWSDVEPPNQSAPAPAPLIDRAVDEVPA